MPRPSSCIAILALSLILACCSADNVSPEGAVKAFMAAVASLKSEQAYNLLAPETQRELQRLAEKATLQTGGRHQQKPEEMLLLGLVQSRHEVHKMELISQDDQRAKVKLISKGKAKATEELELVKVDGGWRVLLKLSAE